MSASAKATIRNIHPRSRIKKQEIAELVKRVLKSEGVSLPVDVIFVDDDFMKKMNRRFTGRRRTTDVLSFGMKEGKNIGVNYPSLGDIYVSLDQAQKQAREYGVSRKEETRRLVIHGLLHLLGYDHKSQRQAEIMKDKEKAYLNWSAGQKPSSKITKSYETY